MVQGVSHEGLVGDMGWMGCDDDDHNDHGDHNEDHDGGFDGVDVDLGCSIDDKVAGEDCLPAGWEGPM